ncbi:MAG: hypothetical protein ACYDFT_05595 [Thermoplasmata archaeon]
MRAGPAAGDRAGSLTTGARVGLGILVVVLLLLAGLGSGVPRAASSGRPSPASGAGPTDHRSLPSRPGSATSVAFLLNGSAGTTSSVSMGFSATVGLTAGFIDPGTTLNATATIGAPPTAMVQVTVLGTSTLLAIPPLGNFGPVTVPGLTYTYLGYSLTLTLRTFGTILANSSGGSALPRACSWSANGAQTFPVEAPTAAAPGTAIAAGLDGLLYSLSVGINATGTVPLLGTVELPVVPFGPVGHGNGMPSRVLGNYTVTAPLTILGFAADPSTAPTDASVVLNVSVSGGNPPLSYRYLKLPAGCPNGTTSTVYCVPTAPGSYTVRVLVTDAQGIQRSANASLTITGPGGVGGGGSGTGTAVGYPLLAALLVGVAAVAIAAGILIGRKQRKRPAPSP